MSRVTLIDRDHGVGTELARYRNLPEKALEVRVGIQGDRAEEVHENSDLTVAEIAAVHEYGAPSVNIPARPFVRPPYDNDPDKWLRLLIHAIKESKGSNLRGALRRVGEELRKAMIEGINAGIPPPLQPATIERKGEDTPLVDTGTMRDAISVVVATPDAGEGGEPGGE